MKGVAGLVAGLIILLSVSAAWAQALLTVPDVNGRSGEHVMIPVLIEGGGDLSGLQFGIGYDPGFLRFDSQKILPGEVFADHGIDVVQSNGAIYLILYSPSLSSLKSSSGVLVQLTAEVLGGQGKTTLEVGALVGADTEGNRVAVSGQRGALRIGEERNLPSSSQNRRIFPHMANGSFSGGRFQTTMVFANSTEAPAQARLRFASSGNTPFSVNLEDGRSLSTVDFEVPARGSLLLRTDGTGALATGYAELIATAPLSGTILFQIQGGDGRVSAEVGVAATPTARTFEIPILYRRGVYNTGIALVNPSHGPTEMTLRLRRPDGTVFLEASETLDPFEHRPQFATQFFGALTDLEFFEGSLDFVCSQPIAALALKQSGFLLTSFPVTVSE